MSAGRGGPVLGALGRVLARLGLLLASLVLVLAVAEGVARIAWARRAPRSAPSADPGPKLTGRDLLKPNQSGYYKRAPYRTNDAGFRGPDWSFDPAPGTFRVAVVGDSVVAAAGVAEEDAYASVLERLLQEKRIAGIGLQRFEVVNLGLGGLHAEQVMRRLRRAADHYRFHLVVYGWTPNDIEGEHYREVEAQQRKVHWSQLFGLQDHPSYLVRMLAPRVLNTIARLRARELSADPEVLFNYLENEPAWRAFEVQLDALTAFARERGICAHVFLHSRSEGLLPVHERVADAARRRGLSVSHAMPTFEGLNPSDFWLSPYDSHHNEAGNALMAKALYQGLQTSLPLECWNTETGPWRRDERGRRRRAGGRR